ncbi:MAG: threonine--tRNA ligase [Candidatus Omnitrophica bacterium]|nr:threonine--tRNA ligase [Candidatus Omnitrophota bacterium]MCM8791408.1 threonine--tRNA ligase [Candidatus Omnitrophota bacterium]
MDLSALRHSASHVMAQAVKMLWPEVKLGIGPAIEDGFYYDFDKPDPFEPEDLDRIEDKMRDIIRANYKFERQEISKEEAIKIFKKRGEKYKLELIQEIADDKVSIYKDGDFIDLCRGPHVESTGKIRAFKLLSIAGAYWHGLETNPMLQRIYGTAFETEEELNDYLVLVEEAKKRDHRLVGKQLGYFSLNEEVGPGLVLYHPKGAMLRFLIEDYIRREHLRRGYQLVLGPHIMKSDIWIQSGHFEYYKENMYIFKIEGQEYAIKPMNCPGHILVYKSKTRSYRDLPIRYFELGTVYRNEKSGVLHGLLRVRGFTQDDAHIFCLHQQVEEEIIKVIDFVIDTLNVFGFEDFAVEISTRPAKSIGKDEDWDAAHHALSNALKRKYIRYSVNEGEGAFYGPKIDIKLKDALKREWQCATIQCDFALPERFDLTYIGEDGKEHRPIMLHRVILGSVERFTGALLEHFGGALPLWLSPCQVMIIPISEKVMSYAKRVEKLLIENGIRAELDYRNERLQKKIRDAELEKVPYMVIIGEKEAAENSLSIRSKAQGEMGRLMIEEFMQMLQKEIKEKVR